MMETRRHTMQSLFNQLGLESSDLGISKFIDNHQLNGDESLDEAEFWSTSQATFIRESWLMDADWVGVIEQLNVALRKQQH
ncbi:MAG: DUF2789 domain-containing protein [bacterium]